jgi:hypothetical protein
MSRVIAATKLASTAMENMNIPIRTGRPPPEGIIRPEIHEAMYHSRIHNETTIAGVPAPPKGPKTSVDGMKKSSIKYADSKVTESNLGFVNVAGPAFGAVASGRAKLG